ncbi:hypothetical protein EYZ11_012128 [Aspergillus tanneri]|uniref:Uncharacterized protein n=1 Tax=Aspergillus tanneri TaxID=1220188 RepID=A0A4S3J135_9EURO|nr:uncharacterized protein ATNIH1004_002900 [Aspergillus tanneri]KAA8650219.1 hypothetical protein ATNIH1004_002900 [Aspergillus tanneri]THC88426.1 hypothetical protein EYZ11_012128 [Aspergillus tanneri]
MLFPSVRNVGLLVLGALIAVNPILSGAHDVSVPLDPLGPLKVALDYGLATTWPQPQDLYLTNAKRNWQFSSHIVFASRVGDSDEENPPVSDGQLWQIARDAVDEMIRDRKQYGIVDRAEPTAMGILAWGNEIILASSMKGAGSFSYDFLGGDTTVGKSLQKCQIVWRDNSLPDKDKTKIHKNKGNCAEPMAAHLYYKNNGKNLKDQKARVGTWVIRQGVWAKTDPCGTGSEDFWGCNLFAQDQGLRALSTTTLSAPYTLANLAGGPTIQEQIQLCGGQPRVFVG